MRYLIVEKENGIFLGMLKHMALFSKTNMFPIKSAISFDSEKEAEMFANSLHAMFSDVEENMKFGVISIDANDRYVHLYDILKAGYANYAHGMMHSLYMPSDEIH
jgi:hypothetical protein